MFKIIKDFNQIIILSFLCIFLGIITFLTFIGEGFIELNDKNLQILLIIDIIVLIIFFYLIFKNIYKFYLAGKKIGQVRKQTLNIYLYFRFSHLSHHFW